MLLTTLCWATINTLHRPAYLSSPSPCEVGFKRWNNSPRFLHVGSVAEQVFEFNSLASIPLTTKLTRFKPAMETDKIP